MVLIVTGSLVMIRIATTGASALSNIDLPILVSKPSILMILIKSKKIS